MNLPSVKIVWVSSILAIILAGVVWGYFDKKSNSLPTKSVYCNGELSKCLNKNNMISNMKPNLGPCASNDLEKCIDKEVWLSGILSEPRGRHGFNNSGAHTETAYLDTEKFGQIVILLFKKLPVPIGTKLKVYGTVWQASYLPESASEKMPLEELFEYHILVDKWEVISEI